MTKLFSKSVIEVEIVKEAEAEADGGLREHGTISSLYIFISIITAPQLCSEVGWHYQ